MAWDISGGDTGDVSQEVVEGPAWGLDLCG